jgi:3-phosphoshikimate 1-carboxyvinyltransferase
MKSLNDLGSTAYSTRNNGCAPIVVGGGIKGGTTSIECPCSQYLTALLMATPLAQGDSIINVPLLHERPYVEMTLRWLDELGIKLEYNEDMSVFKVPGNQSYPAFEKAVPADFSSATFFLCAAALAGEGVTLKGLDINDAQGDKAVIDYLKRMGAEIEIKENNIIVNSTDLKGVDIDMNATPDAIPAMAVTACFADGTTRLLNVPQARMKETDRITVMCTELKKLGADIEELEDGLIINGKGKGSLTGGDLNGYGDHRVVMSLAFAGLMTNSPVTIDTAEAMAVTFPNYTDLMNLIGAKMEKIN